MRNLVITLLLALVSGCSVLASKEATVGCQVADLSTTALALKGGAVEANPIMAKLISAVGIPGFIAFKLGVAAWLVHRHETLPPAARAGINGLTCGAAINNAVLLVR